MAKITTNHHPTKSATRGVALAEVVEQTWPCLADSLAKISGPSQFRIPARLELLGKSLDVLHDPIRKGLEQMIREVNSLPCEQRSLGSLEANENFASKLQRLLSSVGERLCCPKCFEPGTFVCRKGNSPQGAFEFRHSKNGKRITHGGWSRIPELKLATSES